MFYLKQTVIYIISEGAFSSLAYIQNLHVTKFQIYQATTNDSCAVVNVSNKFDGDVLTPVTWERRHGPKGPSPHFRSPILPSFVLCVLGAQICTKNSYDRFSISVTSLIGSMSFVACHIIAYVIVTDIYHPTIVPLFYALLFCSIYSLQFHLSLLFYTTTYVNLG